MNIKMTLGFLQWLEVEIGDDVRIDKPVLRIAKTAPAMDAFFAHGETGWSVGGNVAREFLDALTNSGIDRGFFHHPYRRSWYRIVGGWAGGVNRPFRVNGQDLPTSPTPAMLHTTRNKTPVRRWRGPGQALRAPDGVLASTGVLTGPLPGFTKARSAPGTKAAASLIWSPRAGCIWWRRDRAAAKTWWRWSSSRTGTTVRGKSAHSTRTTSRSWRWCG